MSCDNDVNILKDLSQKLKEYTPNQFIKTGVSPLEHNQECINFLRFLLDDEAFSPDFLITSIFAYYEWEKHQQEKTEPYR